MLDINSVINQMLILLIMLAVGYIAGKAKVIDEIATKRLSHITLSICQSAMILSSVMNMELELSVVDVLKTIGVSFALYVILILVAQLTPLMLGAKGADRGVYKFMTTFGNVGFMGFPVVAAVFGSEYVIYASIFNIPFNILTYTIGIYYLSSGEGAEGFSWKKLINMPLLVTFPALFLLFTRMPVPIVIATATDSLGDMVVPCAMMVIGATLSFMPVKEVLLDWRVYVFSLFRLIGLPVIVWAILRLFVHDPIVLGISTVLAAMPVASNATLLSVQYGCDKRLASRGVFLSTVLSVVTIPVVVYLLLI